MKIKCIANRFKNVTLDFIYETDSEILEGSILVTGNDGVKRNYRASNFEKFEDVLIEVENENEGVFESEITYDINIGDEITVNFNNEDENDFNLYLSRPCDNCGIIGVDNISDLYEEIIDYGYTQEDFKKLIIDISVDLSGEAAFLMLSTNTLNGDLCNALDTLSNFTSETRRNPNSDNNIKVWFINL